MYFSTNHAERLRITSAGAAVVGGTSAQASDAVTLMPDGEVTAAGFYFSNNIGAAMNSTGIRRHTTNTMVFDTDSTERLRIDSAGKIGVGQAPNTKFNVKLGVFAATGDDDASDWGTDGIFQLDHSGGNAANNEVLLLGAVSGGVGQIASCIGFGRESTSNWGTYLSFKTHSTGTSNIDELIERVRINSNGQTDFKVGSGEVDIYSTGSGTQYPFRLLNSDASAGNQVGIYFGPANNVAGAYIAGYSNLNFSSTSNRSASLIFGVRNAGNFIECAKFTNGGFFKATNSTGNYETHTFADSAHEFNSQQRYKTTLWLRNTNTNFENGMLRCAADRGATSSYHFFTCTSGDLSDDEFRVRGDGQVYADGSFNSGGADYAEYFEWTDGNSSNEDRRGMTVILDGNKVKLSTSSDSTDNIIGVVSGNASVIGDAASEKWTDKYLRDDYNQYILDSDGYRQLNSSYDDTKTYIPRENRQEWDAIGMVGKLRIRKGQKTGIRWIKMRDISDTVEEWLVR